jgi:hypothetical protein
VDIPAVLARFVTGGEDRRQLEWSFQPFYGRFAWNLWTNPNVGLRGRWRSRGVVLMDIFGDPRVFARVLETRSGPVQAWEGDYLAEYAHVERVVHRPRFPWNPIHKSNRWEVTFPDPGFPVSTTSHIKSFNVRGACYEDAMAAATARALEMRRQFAGDIRWRPTKLPERPYPGRLVLLHVMQRLGAQHCITCYGFGVVEHVPDKAGMPILVPCQRRNCRAVAAAMDFATSKMKQTTAEVVSQKTNSNETDDSGQGMG